MCTTLNRNNKCSGGVAHVILLHDIILYHMNVFVSLDIATPKSSISSGDGQLPVDVYNRHS